MGVLWPQLSKVLKPVRWAGSVTGFQARSKDQEILEEEVELDPQICQEEIMSREVELG